ncbi:imelysin family protein [uncultured Pseudoteredinibacter sp.]|uniref:imelysin family protein n=1 Tax=uncultured Pseudoteredinibacter sp. TaxID=1641701 RepID=UPI00261EBAD2|nr:imelysin family protein [uncultured Pseudoteredinibacter sp.]
MLFSSKRFILKALAMAAALSPNLYAEGETEKQVVAHYADIAHATFEDALQTAKKLDKSIATLLASPSEKTLAQAKTAWKAARVPYQQSEVFRFGNAIVDDWEGQLNAWPLDEGLIDYVDDASYEAELGNVGSNANIIANTELDLGGNRLDIKNLSPELLASLNELGGSEANVATGYHAIEFLLWGQDLNGHNPGAGQRPYTDYVVGEQCSNGNCERRREYLSAISQLLMDDLSYMVAQWAPAKDENYRQKLLALSSKQGLTRMLFGMGSLALGELAGERLKVSLEANSAEDEHDCFSDNTHYSHFYNGLGIRNIYVGEYRRVDGELLRGPSIQSLLENKDKKLAAKVLQSLDNSQSKLQALVDSAERKENPEAFDQLIAEGNEKGAEMINASINALVEETRNIELAAKALDIDNLNPDTADHEF